MPNRKRESRPKALKPAVRKTDKEYRQESGLTYMRVSEVNLEILERIKAELEDTFQVEMEAMGIKKLRNDDALTATLHGNAMEQKFDVFGLLVDSRYMKILDKCEELAEKKESA